MQDIRSRSTRENARSKQSVVGDSSTKQGLGFNARAENARATENTPTIREYPEPLPSFSTSPSPHRGMHGLRKAKAEEIHQGNRVPPPFNESKVKDGKRTPAIKAKQKGMHIHPVSIPRPPSSRRLHELLRINTPHLRSAFPFGHPPLIQRDHRQPNQAVGGLWYGCSIVLTRRRVTGMADTSDRGAWKALP